MTISIWRYSHLALAVSSFLFILLASITGIILAFDPVAQKTLPYRVDNFNSITLAEALPAIRKAYPEITDIRVDHNQFVILNGTDVAGENLTVYIDPRTGEKLGTPVEQHAFFQWVTALHRSLFLKEVGRFAVGLTSFLLFLIAASGTVLVIQRQRGVKRFFTRVVKENFAQYYHVVLGRLSLIPIIIVALSGTYLSLARFELIKTQQISHDIDFDAISAEGKKDAADFAIFKNTHLSDVQSIEFPFSEDPEDYYTLKLNDREIVINQINGETLSEIPYTQAALWTSLSLDLHTGRTNILWAIVLAIATANILFFIYSGFAITLKRKANKIRNRYKADECRFIILVGSENGSTFRFAKAIAQQLNDGGEKCFIAEMNKYQAFKKAEHVVVLTATYGLGDPPSNAKKFFHLLESIPQAKPVLFSVVGFGSHAYPDFCKYAFEVNNRISAQPWATPQLEIHTVNDRSPEEFMHWASLWSQTTGIPLKLEASSFSVNRKRLQHFDVLSKTEVKYEEGTFLIRLKPKRNIRYTSGDLLAIYPCNDHRERLYSIGKIDDELQLSVKLHTKGIGSNYLHDLQPGTQIQARVDVNEHFHFPNKASQVIMISNGTGIAPFLGMISQNRNRIPCELYCGFRGHASYEVYSNFIDASLANGRLSKLHLAYSREGNKQYVKDLLIPDEAAIASCLKGGGVLMICGSLAMQQNVIELLEVICQKYNHKDVSFYQAHSQILMDCY